MVITIAIVFSVQSSFFVQKYAKYEKKLLTNYIPKTLQKINDQTNDIDLILSNWARNDNLQLLQHSDTANQKRKNLFVTLLQLEVSFIGFYNKDNQPIFTDLKDISTAQHLQVKEITNELPLRQPVLFNHFFISSVYKGLLNIESIPMVIVSRPILDDNGEITGTIIMGRIIDSNVLYRMFGRESFTVSFYYRGNPTLPSTIRLIFGSLTQENPIRIETDKQSFQSSAYHLINDLNGYPDFLIKINTISELEKIRNTTLIQLIVVILVSGAIIIVVVIVLVNNTVLKRILKFDRAVSEFTNQGSTTIRLKDMEQDELSNLTSNINVMVNNLVQLAETAKEQERRFRDILNNVRLYGVIIDENLKIKYVNDFFKLMLDYKESDLLGTNFFDMIIPPQNQEKLKADFIDLFELRKYITNFETDFVTNTGSKRNAVLNLTLMHDTKNKVIGVAILAQDITDYKSALDRIENREKYLRALTETAQLLLSNREEIPFTKFSELIGTACNAQAVQFFFNQELNGIDTTFRIVSEWYSSDEFKHDMTGFSTPISYRTMGLSEWYDQFTQGKSIQQNASRLDKNKRNLLQQFSFKSIVLIPLTSGDEFRGILLISFKTSEVELSDAEMDFLKTASNYISQVLLREQIYHTLELETTYLAGLFESAPEGIVIFNPNNTVRLINQKFTDIFGYSKDELIGKELDEFIVPDEYRTEGQSISESAVKGNYINRESVRKNKNGEYIYVSILGAPIRYGLEVHGIIGLYRDISDKKRQEGELQQSNSRNELLYKLTELITIHQQPEEIYNFAFDHIHTHYKVDKQAIWFLETDGHYRCRAVYNLDQKVQELTNMLLDKFHDQHRYKELFIVNTSEVQIDELKSNLLKHNLHTIGCFPILSNRLPIGFYFVYFNEEHELKEDERKVFNAIADTLANSERHLRSNTLLKQSEEKFRTLFHSAKDGLLLLSSELLVIDVNPAFCYYFGKKKISLFNKSISNELPIEVVRKLQELIETHLDHLETITTDFSVKNKDGNSVTLEAKINKISVGSELRYFISFSDVTDTRRTEKLQSFLYEISRAANLSKSIDEFCELIHIQLRKLFSAENFYIALYDIFSKMYSFPYQVDEFDEPISGSVPLANSLTDFVRKTKHPLLINNNELDEITQTQKLTIVGNKANSWLGVPLITKSGVIGVAVVQTYNPHTEYTQNDMDAFTVAAEQIAVMIEKKRVEDQIIQSELRYRQLFTNNQAIQLLIDPMNLNLLDVNPAASDYYGYTNDELRQLTYDKIQIGTNEVIKELFENVITNQINFRECKHILANGSIRDVEEFLSPVLINEKTVIYAILHDVTSRKEAEAEVKRLATLVESASEAITITDVNGTIIYVNPAFVKLTGFSKQETIGKTPNILKSFHHSEEFYKEFWNTISKGEVWSGRFVNRSKTGAIFYGDATVVPLRNEIGDLQGYAKIERDVTQELELKEKLERSQRLASVGQLTAGVAHNFNNLLTAIIGNIGLAKMISNPEAISYLNIAEQAGNRASDIVRQLLVFSRKKQLEKKILNISLLLHEVNKLVKETIDKRIEIKFCEPKEELTIIGDVGQIHEVILNICMNASDALKVIKESSGKPKRIDITASRVTITKEVAEKEPDGHDGDFVRISISDTGTGMTPEVIKHIFEPFFTTKEQGKGTGLGLATVYGIIKQHDGWIAVESQLYIGTTFHIFLPYQSGTVESMDAKLSSDSAMSFGTETILLIDDEEVIRVLGQSILTKLGYKVLTASNGQEGWEVYQKNSDDIKLILLDLLMPVMSGTELLRLISRSNFKPRIIICTGMSEEPIPTIPGIDAFSVISKPYKVTELAKIVRTAIDTLKN